MSDRNIRHRHDTNVAIQKWIYKMNHNSDDACVFALQEFIVIHLISET